MTTSHSSGAAAGTEAPFLSVPAITLSWIVRLRWGAVAGQTLTVAAASLLLKLDVPIAPLSAIIVATGASNAALFYLVRKKASAVSSHLVAGVLALDTMILCALLYFTGGPSNPFSVLYLVQVTLAALVLGMRWAAAIVALSAASYAFLFFANVPLAGMQHMHHEGSTAFALHLQGMWAAFTLAAGLIAYFVTRVARALRERDDELAEAQRRAARNERLASLSTLAAGAAHELGTPLGTIAIAAKELMRSAEAEGTDAIREDARLIRAEVDRCREIVRQMSAQAGETLGETPERATIRSILDDVRKRVGDERAATFIVSDMPDDPSMTTPARGLVQVLASLVKNAFEASEPSSHVELRSSVLGERVQFAVVDQGSGIAPEDLKKIGDPFFTTKPPGAGMGLGVFLARAFAERLGGELRFESVHGQGTRAVLEVPRTLAALSPHGR